MRRRLRFDLLKTCVISLRGFRGRISKKNETQNLGTLDLNLTPKTELTLLITLVECSQRNIIQNNTNTSSAI